MNRRSAPSRHGTRVPPATTLLGARILPGLAVLVLSLLTGCVSVTVRTSGAASIDDLNAEHAYLAVYMDRMTALSRDTAPFAASGANPGVCNKGGTKQGCYDADRAVIADLDRMLEALRATTVPPRFAEADRLLRDAIAKNVQGLELRNQAIAHDDNVAWQQHGPLLEEAAASWKAAYAAFPADDRPPLAP